MWYLVHFLVSPLYPYLFHHALRTLPAATCPIPVGTHSVQAPLSPKARESGIKLAQVLVSALWTAQAMPFLSLTLQGCDENSVRYYARTTCPGIWSGNKAQGSLMGGKQVREASQLFQLAPWTQLSDHTKAQPSQSLQMPWGESLGRPVCLQDRVPGRRQKELWRLAEGSSGLFIEYWSAHTSEETTKGQGRTTWKIR